MFHEEENACNASIHTMQFRRHYFYNIIFWVQSMMAKNEWNKNV